jgi:hypothetical protein
MHGFISQEMEFVVRAASIAQRLRRLNDELGGSNLSGKDAGIAPESVKPLLEELSFQQSKLSDALFSITDQIDRLENLLGMMEPQNTVAGRGY